MSNNRELPEATVGRLPVYLRALQEGMDSNDTTVSSQRLAELSGVNAAKVRKDLSYLGTYGIRGVGYDVRLLVYRIQQELGLTQDWPVAIVGFGNLGHALANYKGFAERGFRIAAIFDSDDAKVGERIGEVSVRHTDDLNEVCREEEIAIAIIATPAGSAQEVANRLTDAGVKAILNFAPVVINARNATVRKVDLSMELQILTFYQQRTKQIPDLTAGED
jgi:redox-sensing transcriptional repressor